MNKKPIKPNPTIPKPKPQQTTAAAASYSSPTQTTTVHSYEHSCDTQHFVLIWLDEKIAPNHADSVNFINQIKSIAHKTDVFNDFNTCVEFIKKIEKEKVLFIVSGRLGERAVAALHPLEAIVAIFIFSDNKSVHESWIKQWNKIRGVFTDANNLSQALKASVEQIHDENPDISFISLDNTAHIDTKRLDQSFMYTTLIKDILLALEYDKNSFEDFIQFCREKYADDPNQLKDVQKLETGYREKSLIWCYTLDTFFYEMINQVLFGQDFDGIIRIGFFIKKLHEQITDLHVTQYIKTKQPAFPVYRGQGMSKKRFELFRRSKGGLLSFNNFLSTSIDKNIAKDFVARALSRGAPFAIYFTITVDPSVRSVPFASIENYTSIKGEKEILFSMLTIFRIESIEQSKYDIRVWDAKITLTSMDDKDLTQLTQQIQDEIKGPTALHRLGALLIRLNQLDKAEEVCKKAMDNKPTPLEEAQICYQLGQIQSNRGKSLEAIGLYTEALTIYLEQLGPDHENIATIYNNMGSVYSDVGQYPQALKFYQKVLPIYQKKLPGNHLVIGTCYNNIATVHDNMKDYQQALLFYEKSYQIYDQQLSPIDPRRAMYNNNVGLVYLNLKRYSEALSSFENAVRIGKLALPPDDPNLQAYMKSLKYAQRKVNE